MIELNNFSNEKPDSFWSFDLLIRLPSTFGIRLPDKLLSSITGGKSDEVAGQQSEGGGGIGDLLKQFAGGGQGNSGGGLMDIVKSLAGGAQQQQQQNGGGLLVIIKGFVK